MNRLLTSVTVHYKNGEKQKLALVETERDFVIAPYFISETEGWHGSGDYLVKTDFNAPSALIAFANRVDNECTSVSVDRITF